MTRFSRLVMVATCCAFGALAATAAFDFGVAVAAQSGTQTGTQPGTQSGASPTPKMVADELMAADRAFSAAGANADLITSLSAMFAENVTMPTPPGRFAKGKAEAVAALKANPANAQSKAVWTPVRVGVSADGLHGFSFGVMSIKRGDGANAPAKYLAYWVKGADGWRVVAYKRVGRAEGQVPSDLIAPALPMQMVKPVTDVAAVEQHRTSLIASSGDLGVTFGFIKPNSPAPNAAAAGATAGIPFFTIWRRAGPNAPWRHVAE